MSDSRIQVNADGRQAYDIVIREHFYGLLEEMPRLNSPERKVCIVTDRQVASYYLQPVFEMLQNICFAVKVFVFEAGEKSKNLDTVRRLYEFLIRNGYDRKDMLIALGGGVVGDLTGFTAATYLRGIDYVQIPTSLLAQVDSSIGGKTGVDFSQYKNMVGAFYMPKLVYINIDTLTTLSGRQYNSGLGEVIKHGLIRDPDYYRWVRDNRERIAAREPSAMAVMVEGSIKIKKAVVEEDPRETGIRALLNFGHTLGHSLEKCLDFSYTHGECVGMGCLLAAAISARRGMISGEDLRKIGELFHYFRFPDIPDTISPEDIVRDTRYDKKMEHGVIKFILLDRIGEAVIRRDVTQEEMLTAFRVIQEADYDKE